MLSMIRCPRCRGLPYRFYPSLSKMIRPPRTKPSPKFIVTAGVLSAVAIVAILAFKSATAREPAAEPTTTTPNKWTGRWDATVGLWWQEHPGHTGPVRKLERTRPAPSAAARLLLAAQ